MRRALVLAAIVLVACGDDHSGAHDLAQPDLAMPDLLVLAGDGDLDGLTDDEEGRLARDYLPFLAISPGDACPVSGLVVRVTPTSPAPLVALRYAWLFDRSCDGAAVPGAGGVFVVLADPRRPAPDGFVSLRAISRRDTTCQRVSTCGRCPGQLTCGQLGGRPAVWASRDRHGLFADQARSCNQVGACLSVCEDAAASASPPLVDVGEPAVPRVRDLTQAGVIGGALGWQSSELFGYDPWGEAPFGLLPPIGQLLTDPAFDPPGCALN